MPEDAQELVVTSTAVVTIAPASDTEAAMRVAVRVAGEQTVSIAPASD